MHQDKLLILTSKDDSHTDYVIEKLNNSVRSDRVIRINTEDTLTNLDVVITERDFIIQVKDSGKEIRYGEIQSVWYRRPMEVREDQSTDPGIKQFKQQQATAVLRGLYFATHDTALWVNPLPAMHRGRVKIQQLFLAAELGLHVPETLVTNNPKEALRFFDRNRIVCNKSLDQPNFVIGDVRYPYLTRLVSSRVELEESAVAIQQCPTLFQQYVQKSFDIRVIALDNEIFAVAIHSQSEDLSTIDFRGLSPHNLKHEIHQLPQEIEQKIFAFMRRQGLIYSAFDFVVSREGQYYFIENNCNGQWLWLELLTKASISDKLIKLLCNGK